ncbi:MAG: hypothetical protein PHN45_00105 [Methylococcales bacterium]|nr:hypothetical protein [Methylococcales bacterium]
MELRCNDSRTVQGFVNPVATTAGNVIGTNTFSAKSVGVNGTTAPAVACVVSIRSNLESRRHAYGVA